MILLATEGAGVGVVQFNCVLTIHSFFLGGGGGKKLLSWNMAPSLIDLLQRKCKFQANPILEK